MIRLFVFKLVYDGDDRLGFLCQDGMSLLSMLPINCCPQCTCTPSNNTNFFIRKVFPDCEIDPLAPNNFLLRHFLPNIHSRSGWTICFDKYYSKNLWIRFSLLDWDIGINQPCATPIVRPGKKFNPNPLATKNKMIKSATNFVHINCPAKCRFIHCP